MRRGDDSMPYLGYNAESLYAPLYDYQHVDAVLAFQTFFARPMGTPTPHGGVRTSRDTNMYLAHELPSGVRFLVTGIRVLFIPDYLQHRGRKEADEQDARRVLFRWRAAVKDRVPGVCAGRPAGEVSGAHAENLGGGAGLSIAGG